MSLPKIHEVETTRTVGGAWAVSMAVGVSTRVNLGGFSAHMLQYAGKYFSFTVSQSL